MNNVEVNNTSRLLPVDSCENSNKKLMFFVVVYPTPSEGRGRKSHFKTKQAFFETQSIKKTLWESCAYPLHVSKVYRLPGSFIHAYE